MGGISNLHHHLWWSHQSWSIYKCFGTCPDILMMSFWKRSCLFQLLCLQLFVRYVNLSVQVPGCSWCGNRPACGWLALVPYIGGQTDESRPEHPTSHEREFRKAGKTVSALSCYFCCTVVDFSSRLLFWPWFTLMSITLCVLCVWINY